MAWGLFEKRDTESMSRVVSARTLDGQKVRAKLMLSFPRAVAQAEADGIMMKYARAYARAVESELSGGTLPFDEQELLRRLTTEVQDLPRQRVRVMGLHLWTAGSPSSQSMAASGPISGQPTMQSQRTVTPSQGRAVGSTTPTRISMPASVPGGSGAPTPPSFKPAEAPVSGPNTLRSPANQAAPQAAPSAPAAQNATVPSMRIPSLGALDLKALNVPLPPIGSVPPVSERRPSGATVDRAVERVERPVERAVERPVERPIERPVERVVERVSVAPERLSIGPASSRPASLSLAPRTFSGFHQALEGSTPGNESAVGTRLSPPIRRAASQLLLGALDAAQAVLEDPLLVFDSPTDNTRQALTQAACACVSSLLYDVLVEAGVEPGRAVIVVEQACRLATGGAPASHVGRYLGGLQNAQNQLTGDICSLFGIEGGHDLARRLEATLRAVRQELLGCTSQIQRMLPSEPAVRGRRAQG
jgi:hypothetical protein